ncbi:MAG TPA: chaperone NapD [Noviherbaspirillum sp.]|uniref:chaperone NapD n=1 Tax=Noviherbaspirillum sp. TaxID=1926288 RepID=UPI002D734A2D|nr:chaperone NapD [Noviherbaspirillum sp.]HYD94102.1 chaperone NapD [Noviherbaspirillum sp.]
MEQEIHIAGIVVYTQPAQLESIKSCIAEVPYAEVHAQDAHGKLVVTLETEGTKRTLDTMDAIRALPGVLDTVLVYQHAEPASALAQEIL